MVKVLSMLGLSLLCTAAAVAEATVSAYLPPMGKFKRAEVIKPAEIPGGPAAHGAAAGVTRSLNGQWKISGLETAAAAFPADADSGKGYEAPGFDDSKWDAIAVPLNWYKKYPGKQNAQQPYVKGWYRTGFELTRQELERRRVILKFDVVGCDATVYLNGKEVGRHLGDFTAFEVDATDAAKVGKNILALRVFSDQGMLGGVAKVTHVYGSQWSLGNIKGGIWQDVTLSLEPEIRIRKLLVTPRLAAGGIDVDYTILNHTGKTVRAELTALVSPAIKKDSKEVNGILENKAVELKPGVNSGSFSITLNNATKWSVTNPYLYFLTLNVKEANKVVSSDAVRFGYREFVTKNGKFFLNGEEIYLFGQNLGSVLFGGNGLTAAQEEAKLAEMIGNYRNLGYIIMRTSHMPILPLALEIADELGMMVFHEWGWSFTTGIDFKEFEKNNLREVAEFVESSYNHPSVTMWSMGNEVVHRNSPNVAAQMDLQVGVVRKLDKSKRPISTFSGAAGWRSYGETKLDTDVHDLHTYTALSSPWTKLPKELMDQYEGELRIYGDQGRLSRPLISWENVGFSWGTYVDPNFKRGDVRQYAQYVAKPTNWGQPNGVGFIGCSPLFKAVGPDFANWAQALYGRRIFELYRLDDHYTGFAPWFGGIRASTLWNQTVFPSLHSENFLFPRNLFLGEKSPWILEVVNSGNDSWQNLKLDFALARSDREIIPIGEVDVAKLAGQSKFTGSAELAIPADLAPGNYQLRLTLRDGDRVIGQNYYDLYLQSRSILTRKIDQKRPIFILDTGAPRNIAELKTVLDRFGLKYRVINSLDQLKEAGLLVVPAEVAEEQKLSLHESSDLTNFLRNLGGTLLVLEQKNMRSVMPGNQAVASEGNTFVDLVSPEHPLFAGLDYTSFDTWNNPDLGFVVTATYMPYTVNALAVKGPMLARNNVGNAIVEACDGKGRIILSQLETMACHQADSVAATYLYNLFNYAAGSETYWQNALPLADAVDRDYTVADAALVPIDLTGHANVAFADENDNDGKGGWTDQGNNDFRVMPLGEQSAAGVKFHIIDPAKNNGKSCLVVRGSARPHFPAAIRGIKVNEKLSRIFFMHTAAWGGKGVAGTYRMHYADGKTADYVIQGAHNIGDWWTVGQLPAAKIGIVRKNAMNHEIGTFVTAWENPRPEVPVKSIDFLSATEARGNQIDWLPSDAPIPVLIAVTGEKVSDKAVNLLGPNFLVAAGTKELDTGVPGLVKVEDSEHGKLLAVTFPAVSGRDCPALRIGFRKDKLGTDYNYLSCWIKSQDDGVVQFILPENDWKGRFSGELAIHGDGKWHKYRLMFGRDFKAGGKATQATLRGELFLFHRSDRAPGAKRAELKFEIKDIILE